ncbi:putative protein phosphatase 1 regulatory subunit 16A isoform X4 [Daphnia sinensis]|uniref:Uncharacterized protein n=1 Tax=Daphnia sinensis TaxID=1820382 RepID=A0AAD5KUH8_9CRUS|nr:putative protein phosphatase 1 regulatory subunit 16A isoform X4 [Daphnia sinensis]
MDHSDLVAELPRIEKLTAAERLKIARDRRVNQILRHEQYERDFPLSVKKDKFFSNHRSNKKTGQNRGIHFVHSVILLEAAARNDIEEVRRLLLQGVCPDSQNEDGLTALHQCCIDDSESMMKLLLEFGANVNAEDSEKWTPLHAAATCGHLHLVKYLIGQGANMLAVNADGNMPYDICEDEPTLDYIESEMAREGVTQELIDEIRASTEKRMLTDLKNLAAQGESLEYVDSVGARPLHIAAANGYLSVVEFLLDQHVATDSSDNDGWQPIHAAACWGHLEIVELLVQNGSDLNAQTKNHETPYDICEDPEMKARIAALRTEQESRARAGNQKTKRSQSTSTNTRTHSIRRNSTRDKGQISKRQIKNEAIFVIHQDDERRTNHQSSNDKTKADDQGQRTTASADADAHTTASFSSRLINSNKRHAPPPPPPSSSYKADTELNVTKSPSSGNVSNGNPSPSNTWSSATKKGAIDDVNSTVTTNASQSASLPKYQGETTDLVGKKNASSSCCTLS